MGKMPTISHLLSRHEVPNPIQGHGFGNNAADFTKVLVNGALSVLLVLLGGFFAGLTLALMGQDEVTLRVLASSGKGRQKSDAQKVLSILQKGKHWVLVTLVLGNVIVNEALPIVLDGEMKGGWIAVIISTGLVVVFGEIIPQSVCAKYGLAIGAGSSTLVIWLMYILSPIGYPIACLLDYLLGTYHDRTFSREGLKTLIMLHEVPRSPLNNPDRLHTLEASSICNLLSISTVSVSDIMTLIKNAFTLPSDTYLNEIVRFEILKSGFNMIPIHDAQNRERFLGFLNVKSLIGVDFTERDVMVSELELIGLRTVAPGTKLTEIMGIFRNRAADMVLITEGGKSEGKALGIVTCRDLMESTLGREMAMS